MGRGRGGRGGGGLWKRGSCLSHKLEKMPPSPPSLGGRILQDRKKRTLLASTVYFLQWEDTAAQKNCLKKHMAGLEALEIIAQKR